MNHVILYILVLAAKHDGSELVAPGLVAPGLAVRDVGYVAPDEPRKIGQDVSGYGLLQSMPGIALVQTVSEPEIALR